MNLAKVNTGSIREKRAKELHSGVNPSKKIISYLSKMSIEFSTRLELFKASLEKDSAI